MKANYHTHTLRCHHAVGDIEDYILAAKEAGIHTLGFSEHTPYVFPDGFRSNMRLQPEEFSDYAADVRKARAAHPEMQIHLGLEVEYFPKLFPDLMDRIRDEGIEYIIMGQHWLDTESGAEYNGDPTVDVNKLIRYCDHVIEGMQTGLFTYIAHPDLIRFRGERGIFEAQLRRICREAKACNIPLEINLHGLRGKRHYPNPLFWQIAREEGCSVILGRDAHKPIELLDTATMQRTQELLKEWDLEPIDTLSLITP